MNLLNQQCCVKIYENNLFFQIAWKWLSSLNSGLATDILLFVFSDRLIIIISSVFGVAIVALTVVVILLCLYT